MKKNVCIIFCLSTISLIYSCGFHLSKHDFISQKTNYDDSIKFDDFFNNFKETAPPLIFDWKNRGLPLECNKIIPDSIAGRYICDIINYHPFVCYQNIARFTNSKNYKIVIYRQKAEIEGGKTILATYSKNGKAISRLILWGDFGRYYIESKIDSELLIKLRTIYSYERQICEKELTLPSEEYKGLFYIQYFDSEYKIQQSGVIDLVKKTKWQVVIAKRDSLNNSFIYPIDIHH
jgi:hypothetical protein